MDLTEQNLESIQSVHLHNMTVEELVEADRRVESRFHLSGGIWWREVKPFFYQPAAFMTPIPPHKAKPSPWRALGGYYHMVPEGSSGNGRVVVNEISHPAGYALDGLKKQVRYDVRRGLSHLRIRRVENLDDLLNEGYRVYLSWEERTQDVRVQRSDPQVFRRWMTATFHHPHEVILGAYEGDRLVSYVIFHAVDGIAEMTKSFNDVSLSRWAPSSTLLYAYIKICGQNAAIQRVCHGLRAHKESLENYKAKFGFRHVEYPAYIRLRAALRPLAKWLMPGQYRRLMGQYRSSRELQA